MFFTWRFRWNVWSSYSAQCEAGAQAYIKEQAATNCRLLTSNEQSRTSNEQSQRRPRCAERRALTTRILASARLDSITSHYDIYIKPPSVPGSRSIRDRDIKLYCTLARSLFCRTKWARRFCDQQASFSALVQKGRSLPRLITLTRSLPIPSLASASITCLARF